MISDWSEYVLSSPDKGSTPGPQNVLATFSIEPLTFIRIKLYQDLLVVSHFNLNFC